RTSTADTVKAYNTIPFDEMNVFCNVTVTGKGSVRSHREPRIIEDVEHCHDRPGVRRPNLKRGVVGGDHVLAIRTPARESHGGYRQLFCRGSSVIQIRDPHSARCSSRNISSVRIHS